jgi:hypothetical protein
MTQIKALLAFVGAAILIALGALGIGNARGRSKAEGEAEKQRTDENAAASKAVADRRVEATSEASNAQQTVNHMPDDDVDRELRDNWTRKS